jgi:NAD(P)-dependent dehydrogenase (short-subunit alcohol dehydrogenase family)
MKSLHMSKLEELFSLRGQVALVTGASAGLGVELARTLALAGADVALVARRREKLEELARELRDQGVRAAAVPANLTEDEQCAHAVDEAERSLGPVSILVNNAGIAPLGRAERHTREKWDRALALNLTAPFRLCQEVGRRLIERGQGGRIINVTSILSVRANPLYKAVGYAATKAGLLNVTRTLAVEWAVHGIAVNAIAPAWFLTEMTELGFAETEQREIAERRTPIGRLGEPCELRTALLFLASPASSYVTGSTVFVDGGWTAW